MIASELVRLAFLNRFDKLDAPGFLIAVNRRRGFSGRYLTKIRRYQGTPSSFRRCRFSRIRC